MYSNAFQYVIENAIKVRGAPRQFERQKHRSAYRLDVDTFGQYGVCDFDGNGKDDLAATRRRRLRQFLSHPIEVA
jgi:hypothetical protein